MTTKKIPLISIVGPTASGKTGLAVFLAKKYNGEVVSCDSMQIYKEMSIGTAKPTEQEMDGIKHHLIDIFTLESPCSVADYAKLAHDAIADIHKRGKIAILVGGTGLYVNAVITDMQFDENEKTNDIIRAQLKEIFEKDGVEKLFSMLQELDPQEAEVIDRYNAVRLIRAIEVCKTTGGTVADYKKRNIANNSRYNVLKLGVSYDNRDLLYNNINKRVDLMLENGLLDEAKQVLQKGGKTAMQAIGYKELIGYFENTQTLLEATKKLKQETRHYAKRQLTWFRRDKEIKWFYRDLYENTDLYEKNICIAVDNFLKLCYN